MNRLYKTLMVLELAAALGAGLVGWTVTAQAAEAGTPAKPDVTRGQAIATQVCAACHGADGNSAGGAFPKLAGQHAEYIVKQLKDYKTQPGAKEPARKNAIMAGIAGALNDQDMVNVAAYLRRRRPSRVTRVTRTPCRLGRRFIAGALPTGVSRRVPPAMVQRAWACRCSIRGCRDNGPTTRLRNSPRLLRARAITVSRCTPLPCA